MIKTNISIECLPCKCQIILSATIMRFKLVLVTVCQSSETYKDSIVTYWLDLPCFLEILLSGMYYCVPQLVLCITLYFSLIFRPDSLDVLFVSSPGGDVLWGAGTVNWIITVTGYQFYIGRHPGKTWTGTTYSKHQQTFSGKVLLQSRISCSGNQITK